MSKICRQLHQFCHFLRVIRIAIRELKVTLKELPDLLHALLTVMVEVVLTLLAGFGLLQLLVRH